VQSLTAAVALVAVTDLDRAEQFYGATLELALREERPFALVATVGGTDIRIVRVDEFHAVPYTVLGFHVADIEAAVDALVAREVSFNRYDGMGQDERGIWNSPSGARVAWFLDPEGNNLSLTQQPV
jgi:predicted enzyme related to lactoylglutathione lyase